MKFSYSAVWDDIVRLFRAHGSLVVALAGVFIFLPALLTAHFLPQPQAASAAELVPVLKAYLRENWFWLLLENLLNMVGVIAILRLIFPRGGSTVAGVIAAAVAILPFYFLTSLVTGIAIAIGFMLLFVPGLYLFGRLAPVGVVVVAEDRRNPIDAIRRSLEITKGRGWAVLGMVLLVAFAAIVVMLVINNVLGVLLITVAGVEVGLFLSLIVTAATAAAFTALITLLYAAIYRNLAPTESVAH